MSSPNRASTHVGRVHPGVWPTEIPVLDALPEGPRGRLAASVARLDLKAGVTFLREGETTDFLAIVVAGRVAVHLRVPERGPITILTLEPGDIVGWSAIVAPYRATTSVTTLEPTELAMIDAETLRGLLEADIELAAALHPLILDTVVARLAATRTQLLDLFQGREADPW
ncbi:MAG: Crp/Fnr family transcriptional regulator [Chloroflexi bacterium]|nr:Crp/Fnr family transcriptional regulator [Chloroflexota bacterium]